MIKVTVYKVRQDSPEREKLQVQLVAIPNVGDWIMLDRDEFAYDVKHVLHYPAVDGEPAEASVFVSIGGTFPGLE